MSLALSEVFSSLPWHRKLVLALRTLNISALYDGSAARTCKGSSISYVKAETAFWTTHNMLSLRTQFLSLSLKQTTSKILKTFLYSPIHAEILTIKGAK
jgi:hypothetical protein